MTKARLAIAAAVTLVAVAALVGVGGASQDGATVAWEKPPQVFEHPTLPRDSVLAGRVRNTSLEDVDLAAADIRLLDDAGRPVRSTARFLQTYVHGLYPPTQRPKTPNPNEQRQLGEIVTVRPGESAPLTLSWRVAPGGGAPVRAELGRGLSLRLP